jgi:NitT/TauT family transport system substrate-binding protein
VVKASIERWDGEWVSNPEIQISSTVEYARVDKQLGYINKSLSEDDLFDSSFYHQALAPA